MSSGFLAAGVCWSSQLLAAQAVCGALPASGINGSSLRVVQCSAFTSSSITLRGSSCSSSSCVVDAASVTLAPSYAVCDMDVTRDILNLSMADGALVGGAVVVAWGIAWALRTVRHMLGDHGSGSSDD